MAHTAGGKTASASIRPERTSAAGGSSGPFERWLLWNLPPLSGRLRFVFYSGSLTLFFLLDGGLEFTRGYASPYLYEPRGITGLLGVPYLGPNAMRALMAGIYVAWLCAAVGLFTRPAKIATAIGMFVALGFEQAYVTASSHTHYVLLYSLLCLAFSTSDLDWGVDAWLSKRFGGRLRAPREHRGLGATGLPLQALLILVVSTYLSAGVSKLVDAGLVWVDGTSLQYYIGSQVDGTSFAFISSFRTWVADQPLLCRLMSVATLGVELASPLALLSRRLRHLFVAVWVMMHLVIVLLMIPNFWIQSWCVAVLLTDWEWLRRLGLRRFRSWEMPAVEPAFAVSAPRFGATVIGALLLATSAAPTLFQIEWYPFTHIPMYASYMAPGVVAGFPEEDLGIESRVRGIARSCAGNLSVGYIRRCPRQIPSQLAARLSLELHGPGRLPTPFTGRVDALRHHVIAHLATTAPASAGSASTEELARWVGALLASEPPGALDGFDSFTLRYRLNEGAIELASGRFDPLDLRPLIGATSPGSNP